MTIPPAFLRRVAAAAAAETLPRFRRQAAVANKDHAGFDPVTEADQAAERAIRAAIAEAYPGHGLIGEEFGSENGDSAAVWVIDPIDGTRAFISGLPLWGTLVGHMVGGKAVAGLMAQPFTGELYFADGAGAFYEGPGGARTLATRKVERLEEATLCTTTPALFDGPRRALYDTVEQAVRLTRYGTDCYGYAMVAAGHVDLVIESALQPYDIVALIPIIEQAGGVVTTWRGEPAEAGGDIVAAATPALHRAALARLAG
ncbi:histidinol-phosphatase [Aquibium sp. A9E412]|uniref:histidinol-phosphatase n=1 Tax=Aquibium sp. A9E412 TaxID=2976767 RepID=UPI0025B2185C|nr:histidinol-phosphatase [Aquibium sp. A9E412]MDN2565054.1 histidinol-phosphatase [Aquibium sp. A9E412]